jgi:hypothetical protein
MFSDMAQIQSNIGNTYHVRLQGALNSPTIDWFGEITIIPQEHGEILLVSLFVDPAALRSFMDQFRNLNITVLSNEYIKIKNLQAVNA